MSQSSFPSGTTIAYREINERGLIIDMKPVIVVEDTACQLVLWLPTGTETKRCTRVETAPGEPRRWTTNLVNATWKWEEVLIIVKRGERRATWIKWVEDRVFVGWYVNTQTELVRTRLGFDLTDHDLDIVVDPDRRWR